MQGGGFALALPLPAGILAVPLGYKQSKDTQTHQAKGANCVKAWLCRNLAKHSLATGGFAVTFAKFSKKTL